MNMYALFGTQPALLAHAISHLNDIVLITEAHPIDAPGPRIVFVNDAFQARTGYSREDVIGKTPRILQGPKTQRSELDRIRAALARWEPVRAELINYTKSGKEFWLELDIVPVADDKGWFTHWIAIQRDVTDRKLIEAARQTMEAELRDLQKLEALGTLAGGIAHDFNNIIATMLGNTALIRQDLGPLHIAQQSVLEVQKAGHRGRELVQQILSFSRRQPTTLKPVNIKDLVGEAIRMLRVTVHSNTTIRVNCQESLPPILADGNQILQVLMNLASNGLHAMRGRPGQLVFDVHLLQPTGTQNGQADLVRFSVIDTGIGMDEETLAHIFEPFFTTKPHGQGTGLGLSVVHGIVHAHGGSIAVDSELGRGTTFTIDFPVVATGDVMVSQAERDDELEEQSVSLTSGRILYLDDDEAMSFLAKRMLEREGFAVSAYSIQTDAIAAIRADPQAFDLAITDFNMPGMNGIEVAQEWMSLAPELKVALASGFFDDPLLEEARESGIQRLIVKERDMENFCHVIRKLMAQDPVRLG